MALVVTHAFQSEKGDGADPTRVQPSHWNAEHVLEGFGALALLDELAYSALTGKPTLGALAALDALAFSALTGKPTTLSGYGITDAEPLGKYPNPNKQTGTTYTLVLGDAVRGIVEMNNAASNTLTVPPNADVAIPVDTKIDIVQYGAGQTTIAAGSGVTIRSHQGNLKLSGQYAGATLWKRATNEWVLFGNLSA